MFILKIVIYLFVYINLSSCIQTRGTGYRWRDERPDSFHYYRERDQYRDNSQVSYYDRRPPSLSIDDIYREAQRYNDNLNHRFHRQNSWPLVNREQINPNTEAFFNYNQKRNNGDEFPERSRDTRQTLYAPAPHLPWEDALRHSVYLTLIRDKIDNILASNKRPDVQNLEKNGKDIYESADVDLWRHIKKAPFKTNGKDRGPVFGDIAILSRGKLIENTDGFEFVEDDDFKECIECHLYSARPNEDEAERILMSNCNHPNCKNNRIKALWTVRRIRHRNIDNDDPKFMYELMFSIASPKHGSKILDYNNPSQTFTINENDKELKESIDKGSTKVVFIDGKSNDSFRKGKSYLDNFNKNGLNTGEVSTEEFSDVNKFSSVSDPRIMNEYEDNTEQIQHPVITHLHHHYYLDDKGIPMVKPSIKYEKSQYDMRPQNINNNIETNVDPRTAVPSTSKKMDTTELITQHSTKDYNIKTATYPSSRKSYGQNNREFPHTSTTPKTKKNKFIPSPKDDRKIYSELDPLYTTTAFSKYETKASSMTYDSPVTAKYPIKDYTKQQILDLNDKLTGDVTTQFSAQDYEDYVTFPDTETTIENIQIPEITTQQAENSNESYEKSTRHESIHIVYPETTKQIQTITESSTEKIFKKPRIERKPYKITRRVKQKTFSELLKTQEPKETQRVATNKPLDTIETKDKKTIDLQQKIEDINKKFASNKTHNFEPQRTSRQKYQRKFNTWNARRSKVSSSTTTEKNSTPKDPPQPTDIIKESNTEAITDSTYFHNDFQDNVEEESEKEIRKVLKVDETDSRNVESNKNKNKEDSEHNYMDVNSEQNESTEFTTEISITESTDYVTQISDSLPTHLNGSNTIQPSTKTTDPSSDTQESMYSPLTRKSLVTSISLKLGNKTRPFYSYTTKSLQNITFVDETVTNVSESIPMNSTENSSSNATELNNITNAMEYAASTENYYKDSETPEDDVEIARIVEHTSLHKLKIGDQK